MQEVIPGLQATIPPQVSAATTGSDLQQGLQSVVPPGVMVTGPPPGKMFIRDWDSGFNTTSFQTFSLQTCIRVLFDMLTGAFPVSAGGLPPPDIQGAAVRMLTAGVPFNPGMMPALPRPTAPVIGKL